MVSRIFRYLSILLALAGGIALFGINRMQAERRMPAAVEPPISPPEKAFREAVSATGILEAWSDQVRIGSPENGLVAELFVVVNEEVKKGDPLLRLDDRELLAQRILAESKRDVAAASVKVWAAQHEKLHSRLLRMLALNDARAVSVEELENLKHDKAVAEAQLEAARVELSAAESEVRSVDLRISKLTITAPRDGSLIQVNVRPGEQALIAAKEPLMLLGETRRLQVRADVDEQNATRIRHGQRAVATLKGDPSVKLPLEFLRVEPMIVPKVSLTGAGTERVDTRVLQVIFGLDRPEHPSIYVGQQVDVLIEASEL